MSERDQIDLLVIGGGINGAGVARDAAGRGLSVILCEKDDLAQGTSSRSGKLVHGGLRYLEYYEFRLVREALIEREVLLRSACHIIWPMRFVLPHSPQDRPAWLVRLGLFLYDHLGGRRKLPGTRALDLRRDPEGAPEARGLDRLDAGVFGPGAARAEAAGGVRLVHEHVPEMAKVGIKLGLSPAPCGISDSRNQRRHSSRSRRSLIGSAKPGGRTMRSRQRRSPLRRCRPRRSRCSWHAVRPGPRRLTRHATCRPGWSTSGRGSNLTYGGGLPTVVPLAAMEPGRCGRVESRLAAAVCRRVLAAMEPGRCGRVEGSRRSPREYWRWRVWCERWVAGCRQVSSDSYVKEPSRLRNKGCERSPGFAWPPERSLKSPPLPRKADSAQPP